MNPFEPFEDQHSHRPMIRVYRQRLSEPMSDEQAVARFPGTVILSDRREIVIALDVLESDPSRDPVESARRAAGINNLLENIGLSQGEVTEWWNHRSYRELGDRTPTQAWLAGDEQAVRALIDRWYEESESATEQRRQDPEFMAMLRRKAHALRSKVAHA